MIQRTAVSTPPIAPQASRVRAYLLLDVRPGYLDQVHRTLLCCPGVARVDEVLVQGPPHLIVTNEAPTSEALVHNMVVGLIAIEDYLLTARSLPVRNLGGRPADGTRARPNPSG